ncbi:MAG: hypothetical protein U9O66_02015 [Patescibacteria group bacterium]|nr:hypothetical protein [Patescibacteria group bacterium]
MAGHLKNLAKVREKYFREYEKFSPRRFEVIDLIPSSPLLEENNDEGIQNFFEHSRIGPFGSVADI